MKIKGYNGSVPSTNPSKSVMFSTNQQTGGTTYAKGFTQNRNSSSVPFRSCDNFFIFLDSVYDDFPDGPVTNPISKAAWQQASDQSIGWGVIGCTDSEPDGKTYHRCYNFYAAFMGSPITNVAPNPTQFYGLFIDRIEIDPNYSPPNIVLKIYHTFPPPADVNIILNANQCFANFQTLLPGFNPDIAVPTLDQLAAIRAASSNGLIGFGTFAGAIFLPQQAGVTSISEV